MLNQIEAYLIEYAHKVPLEIFAAVGSTVEEIIAPIPSPIIMTVAGSVAELQGKPITILLWLAMFGAIGKVLGAYVLYFFADKGEDFILGRFGKFLGVTHKEIESIGKHFNKGKRDILILILLRATPIVSSTLISVFSGIIKINLKVYLLATLIGTYIKDLLFLYIGYTGLATFHSLTNKLDTIESKLQTITVVVILIIFIVYYLKKRKTRQ